MNKGWKVGLVFGVNFSISKSDNYGSLVKKGMKAHFSQLRTLGLTQLQLRLVHNTWKGLTKKATPFQLSWTCAIGPDMCARVIWCLRKKKTTFKQDFFILFDSGTSRPTAAFLISHT